MRYHKAVEITKAEADLIIATPGICTTDVIALSHGEQRYDVRWMTVAEIDAFVADLARAEIAAADAQTSLPN